MGSKKEYETTMAPKKRSRAGFDRPVAVLTLMAHPDPSRIGEIALLHGLEKGGKSVLSRVAPTFRAPQRALGIPLEDPFLSRNPIEFLPADKDGILVDTSKCGTPVFLGEAPLLGKRAFSSEELAKGVVLNLADRVALLLHRGQVQAAQDSPGFGLVGFSASMIFLRREIERVSDLATPILLRGSSGTGKELVARAIHDAGRPGKPFVSVNMGAIPASLAASELFGAVKGSFTGSSRNQVGYFRAAHGGTLFLDEVGETHREVQVMLLRALESGEVNPIGAQSPVKVTTRLIAATDADLEAKMAEDSFKTPLFHRLAGYEISLPPLSERLEDFGRLFLHFARQELASLGEEDRLEPCHPESEPWLPASLMARLLAYSWPGNVRQLRNAVRQLLIGCRGETSLRMVPKLEQMLAQSDAAGNERNAGHGIDKNERKAPPSSRRRPNTVGKEELRDALEATGWNVKAAAARLRISRGSLYLLIEKTPGLHKAGDLDAERVKSCLEKHPGDLKAAAGDLRISVHALRRRLTELGIELSA